MNFFEAEILIHTTLSLSPRNDDNPIEGDWDDEDDEDFDDQLDAESDLHHIQAGDAADEPDPDDDDHLPDDDLQ
jgi:hypothetical protein